MVKRFEPPDPSAPPDRQAAALIDPAKAIRQAREAAALRENLRRRKHQSRARQQAAPPEPPPGEPADR